jgi:hypothetical protein
MMSISGSKLMRKLLKIVGSLVIVCIALVAIRMGEGYARWYFRVNGSVTVDGHETSGYLHANLKRTVLLLTRTDGKKTETYLIRLLDMTMVDCGDWNPPRFFPALIGDINPPCTGFVDHATIIDPPVDGTVITRQRSIELSTASGRRVKAEW